MRAMVSERLSRPKSEPRTVNAGNNGRELDGNEAEEPVVDRNFPWVYSSDSER
jgi:hypothetical protein